MPVYNGERYLADAIESIRAQTFQDFVLYIADDGSVDRSASIIEKYAKMDSRIHFFRHESNIGLIGTLNRCCSRATTPYIARMDQDDIAMSTRLEKQIKFLEENPHIGIVGTCVEHTDVDLRVISQDGWFPEDHYLILWKMLYTSGFAHPTIAMRKDVYTSVNGYSPSALHVEDYDFFLRAKEKTMFANLQERLLKYRSNMNSISSRFTEVQEKNHAALFKQNIETILSDVNMDILLTFMRKHVVEDISDFWKVFRLLNKVHKAFIAKYNVPSSARASIRFDKYRMLSILALTYKSRSFWRGIFMYFCVVVRSPAIILFNLKNAS
jgi:glycosyltransferase involved in cell wall biosynthesis